MDYTARMPSPALPMVDRQTGIITPAWFRYLLSMLNRTGGEIGVGVADMLRRSGGTMTGPLILSGDPTLPLGAATKQYVDTLPITGAALLSWPSAAGVVVTNGTYELALSWPWAAGRITGLVGACGTGSFTAAVLINGVAVTGLSAVLVSGAAVVTTPAGPNGLLAGDNLTLVVSAVTNATDFTADFLPTDFGSGTAPTDATVQVNFQHNSVSTAVVGGFTANFSPVDFVVPA